MSISFGAPLLLYKNVVNALLAMSLIDPATKQHAICTTSCIYEFGPLQMLRVVYFHKIGVRQAITNNLRI